MKKLFKMVHVATGAFLLISICFMAMTQYASAEEGYSLDVTKKWEEKVNNDTLAIRPRMSIYGKQVMAFGTT